MMKQQRITLLTLFFFSFNAITIPNRQTNVKVTKATHKSGITRTRGYITLQKPRYHFYMILALIE